MGGGDGDEIDRGRREGCEEGVSRENTTPILNNRFGANYTRSSDSKSSEVCKVGSTSSGTLVLKNVPGSAKKTGMGHYKNSHGEICNNVTYISSSRNSLGNSIDPSSGVRNSSSDVDGVSDSCNVRNSLEVRNRLGNSSRCSPHNNTTVALNPQDIIIQPAELLWHVETTCEDVVGVSETPQRGADSKLVVQKRKKEKVEKKKKKFKEEVQKIKCFKKSI